MEGGDEPKQENIRKKDPLQGGDRRIGGENTVAIRTIIVIKSKRNIYKNYSPRTLARKIFFAQNLFIFVFLSSLTYYDCCPTH